MAKKAAKKTAVPKKKEDTTEVRGFLIFGCALIILLSLWSFSLHGNQSKNWIGATVFVIGWSLTA
ncbi:MAG: hypothetical protein WCG42_05875, partial [Parachlamydiaceae bacterium]